MVNVCNLVARRRTDSGAGNCGLECYATIPDWEAGFRFSQDISFNLQVSLDEDGQYYLGMTKKSLAYSVNRNVQNNRLVVGELGYTGPVEYQ